MALTQLSEATLTFGPILSTDLSIPTPALQTFLFLSIMPIVVTSPQPHFSIFQFIPPFPSLSFSEIHFAL